jgi:hypothetical protein
MEKIFEQHVNNIIKIIDGNENLKGFKCDKNCSYYVDVAGENQYLRNLFLDLSSPEHPIHEGNKNAGGKERTDLRDSLGITDWSDSVLIAFLKTTIRGFLRGDMYTAMTEFVSRAEGSFGLQVHCSLEPGVVVIASKGQPMSLAYKNDTPLCLYGSEAEALAVPIDIHGTYHR